MSETTTDKKPRGTVTKDPELVAMNKCVAIINALPDAETRRSVLEFVNRKVKID
jgi:hypothetical protein